MHDKINLAAKFALLDAPYEPGIVGYLNDLKLQIVKVKGRVRLAQARRHRRLLPRRPRTAHDSPARP